jgi:DNA end-binding protein Ku
MAPLLLMINPREISMPRAIWKGAVTFGLVTVPVSLYSATRSNDLAFRLLHKKDTSPIDYRRFCEAEDVEVDWKDIVKGYEYDKGRFVVLTDEDFTRARVPATQTIEILDFVPGAEIDFSYFEHPYWLEPTKPGRKGYALLRAALEQSERVGIGKLVLRQREHLAALRPAGKGLMLTTMRFAHEIAPADSLDLPDGRGADKRELELALRLVDSLAGEWKPERYKDEYREVLLKAIEQKMRGKPIRGPAAAKPAKVIDLMTALRRSLQEPGQRRPRGRRGRASRRAA